MIDHDLLLQCKHALKGIDGETAIAVSIMYLAETYRRSDREDQGIASAIKDVAEAILYSTKEKE